MKYISKRARADYRIYLLVIALSLFGLVMVDSSSVIIAYDKFKGANDHYFVFHQAFALIAGVILMFFVSNFDYHNWKKIAIPLMITTIILLIAVFLPVIGSAAKGAHRWINFGLFPFQPSELAKVTFVIYLCAWLENREKHLGAIQRSLIPFVAMLAIISGLIIMEPDLGTLTIIILTSMVVFFAAGAPIWNFASLGLGLLAVFGIFVKSEPYRWNRFITFLNPGTETLGRGYHINQAFIAVSQGGLWGLGFSKSIQKLKYLPEPHTDSIFAIICEELGFFRASLVIVAYIYFFMLGLRVAKMAPDTFGRLLAIGIVCSIVFQALVNIAAMLGLVPLTGVTLPFVSYGGSSLIICFALVGILLNISKQANAQIY